MESLKMTQVKKFLSLRKKLMVAILFASSLITSITTAFHYYLEYKEDINYLNKSLDQIGSSSSSSLSRSLWNLDDLQIQVQVDSIIKIRDIIAVSVIDEEEQVFYKNVKEEFNTIEKFSSIYPLFLEQRGVSTKIGALKIWATKEHIKESLISSLIVFFFSQFIKTLLVSFTMLFLFRYLVTRHLDKIVRFLRTVDLNSLDIERLKLDRSNKTADELDYVNDSINTMLRKVEKANLETNEKIRTQEKEIQMQKAASINSARLASLGEMAANIAHEINNPLTILAFSGKKIKNLSEQNNIDKERLIHFSNMINKTIDRMCKTINSLKRLARDAENDEHDYVNVYDMVERVLDLCQISLNQKGVKISTEFNGLPDDFNIHCKEVQITQVIVNLINNSVDAILDNYASPWIKIDVKEVQGNIVFSIIDCGHGIPEEIQSKIFEPFFTTKEIGVGTGLGLSISAKSAKDHNGSLWIDNEMKNTTIRLELPVES
jgi:C4-dicarboxylate-specific signal transduction histidine kinase